MGIIKVEGIKIYAFHGCLPEETKIGGNYIVDVHLETDFEKAALMDDLSQTIDYVQIYEIVRSEMAIPSKLIEHVGQRIINKLKSEIISIEHVEVKVTKLNPPMNGDVEKVSVLVASPRPFIKGEGEKK